MLSAVDAPYPDTDERQRSDYLPMHYKTALAKEQSGKKNAEYRIGKAKDSYARYRMIFEEKPPKRICGR